MADEEGEPTYRLVPEGEDARTSSKLFDGKGQATFLNGDVYDGPFTGGQRGGAGNGSYTWANNGDTYKGGYSGDKRHGTGEYVYAKASGEEGEDEEAIAASTRDGKYVGGFEAGKRHGEGTFYYSNGDSYSGSWENDNKSGTGKYTYGKDGSTLEGTWENGWLAHGKWTVATGEFFAGSFKWNQPSGEGVWVMTNGTQQLGTYTQEEDREGQDQPADDEGNPLPWTVAPNSIKLSWKNKDQRW